MTARVDQLATELANQAKSAAHDLKQAYLVALRGILANASARLTAASLPNIGIVLRQLMPEVSAEDEELQVCAAQIGLNCHGARPDGLLSEFMHSSMPCSPKQP
jgi:hypothetical protein